MPKLINQFTSENVSLAHKLIQNVLTFSGIKALVEEQKYVTSDNSTDKGDQLTWFMRY